MESKLQTIEKKIKELESLKIEKLYNSDFLATYDKSQEEIKAYLLVADILRLMRECNISPKIFDSGIAISQFRDQSTRTRFSFASATDFLGLGCVDFDEKKSQIAHGETARETSNMISFMTEVIGIRDDLFIGKGHTYMENVSQFVRQGHKEEVLEQIPIIVNLQSDIDHPTQSMADILHLKTWFGGLDKLKGKKLVMSWAYSPSYAKPLSVPQGIIALLTRYGMDVVLSHPEGYDLMEDVEKIAKENVKKYGGSFTKTNDMKEAFKGAHVVYPKSWGSYRMMKERVKLLDKKDHDGINKLEKEALEENAKFKDWECTEELMKTTAENPLYMHCLPADISNVSCKQGEVEEKVFDKYRVELYKEAGYKPYAIASMMFLGKVKEPAKKLREMLKDKPKRNI